MQAVVLQPSWKIRGMLVIVGFVTSVLFVLLAVTNSPGWALFVLPGVVVVLEGIRARVTVDHAKDIVVSTRAIRRITVPIADISSIRVPPWGPVALMLKRGPNLRDRGLRPGQVLTGLYTGHQRLDPVVARLATSLAVPVESIWPGPRSGDGRRD